MKLNVKGILSNVGSALKSEAEKIKAKRQAAENAKERAASTKRDFIKDHTIAQYTHLGKKINRSLTIVQCDIGELFCSSIISNDAKKQLMKMKTNNISARMINAAVIEHVKNDYTVYIDSAFKSRLSVDIMCELWRLFIDEAFTYYSTRTNKHLILNNVCKKNFNENDVHAFVAKDYRNLKIMIDGINEFMDNYEDAYLNFHRKLSRVTRKNLHDINATRSITIREYVKILNVNINYKVKYYKGRAEIVEVKKR